MCYAFLHLSQILVGGPECLLCRDAENYLCSSLIYLQLPEKNSSWFWLLQQQQFVWRKYDYNMRASKVSKFHCLEHCWIFSLYFTKQKHWPIVPFVVLVLYRKYLHYSWTCRTHNLKNFLQHHKTFVQVTDVCSKFQVKACSLWCCSTDYTLFSHSINWCTAPAILALWGSQSALIQLLLSLTHSGKTSPELILLSLCSEAHLLPHAETTKHLLVSSSSSTSLLLHSHSLKQKVVTVTRHARCSFSDPLLFWNSLPGHITMALQYKCYRRYVRLILAANGIQLDVLPVYLLAYNTVTAGQISKVGQSVV